MVAKAAAISEHSRSRLITSLTLLRTDTLQRLKQNKVCPRLYNWDENDELPPLQMSGKQGEVLYQTVLNINSLNGEGPGNDTTHFIEKKNENRTENVLCLQFNEVLRGSLQLMKHCCNNGKYGQCMFA